MSNPVTIVERETIAEQFQVRLTEPMKARHEQRECLYVYKGAYKLGELKADGTFFTREELLQKLDKIINK